MLNARILPVLILLVTIVLTGKAQTVFEKSIPVTEDNLPLLDYVKSVEATEKVKFFYLPEWLAPYKVDKSMLSTSSIQEVLYNTLNTSAINYVFLSDYAIIFFKDPHTDIARQEKIEQATRENKMYEKLLFGKPESYAPGQVVQFKGVVIDENTREPIIGASIYLTESNAGFATDGEGKFDFKIKGGRHLIQLRAVNYSEKLIDVSLYQNADVKLILKTAPTMLSEVEISDQYIVNKRIGQVGINMTDIKRLPSFLGENDIIKQIQTQSGVTTASEASSGFNVRGGGVDQNLVLYDGVPIFNTAHALGFFTAFNSEAIKTATFYKGGIPAEFGGRASSVLNISSKEGNLQRWSAGGGIGLVSSNVFVEGPIKKDTSSLSISARSSYSDWMLNLLKTRYQSIQNGSVFFYDGSVKYSKKIDKNTKLQLSAYTSYDRFKLSNDTVYSWRNLAISAQYHKTLQNNLSYTAGFYYGQYTYLVKDSDAPTAFDLGYSITYPSVKLDFNRVGSVNKQTFGFQGTYYRFNPGELKPTSGESSITNIKMPGESSVELALYGSDEFKLTDKLTMEAGLRISFFSRLGAATVFHYEDGKPRAPENTIDSTVYSSGQPVKTYINPEPRLTFQYTINQQSSLKLGYNRLFQYVHLVSNSTNITPVDIWQSSNTYFKPQRADQISGGYFRTSQKNEYEFSLEGFYKYLKNILDFKDGANLILNRRLETALLSGTGHAYGVEAGVTKLQGAFTWGLNYTFSRSFRQIKGPSELESVNDGQQYPSGFDQPHIVNLNWRYAIAKRLFFSGMFTYHTGRPISLPLSVYTTDHAPISEFSDRNTFRIPDYHRMDIAFILEPNYKKKKLWAGTWTLSFYNVYARKNPYSVFFVSQGGLLRPYQLSLVGTIVPSVTYSFKF